MKFITRYTSRYTPCFDESVKASQLFDRNVASEPSLLPNTYGNHLSLTSRVFGIFIKRAVKPTPELYAALDELSVYHVNSANLFLRISKVGAKYYLDMHYQHISGMYRLMGLTEEEVKNLLGM